MRELEVPMEDREISWNMLRFLKVMDQQTQVKRADGVYMTIEKYLAGRNACTTSPTLTWT